MNDNSEFIKLDKLLAHPPVLADSGFSERVESRIRSSNSARRNLFLLTGFSWLVLMLIAASPQSIYADLMMIASSLDLASIGSAIEYLYQSLSNPTLQIPYTTVSATIISFVAVISMAVRA